MVVAVVAGVVGAFSPAEPTIFLVSDLVIRAAVAAVVTLAASRARRWTWLVLAALAVVGAPAGPWFWVCAAGAVFGFATTFVPRRRIYGALVGACAIQGLLRLDDVGFSRASAVLFVIAVVPVLASAYAVAPRRVRRRVHRTVAVLAALAVVAALVFLVAVGLAFDPTREAAAKTTSGLELARDGEGVVAAVELADAAESFRAAHAKVDAWWVRPLGAVPLVAQQLHAIEVVTEEGAHITEAAASIAAEADIQALRYEDGQIDVEHLASLAEPLATAADTFERASGRVGAARSPWLVGPLAERVAEVDDELAASLPDISLAALAAEQGPALLGADGERHYLVLFTQPAEARGLGGFVGNWAEVTASDGRLDISASGRTAELNERAGREERTLADPVPADYLSRYGRFRPGYYFQDVTLSPDLPSVAAAVGQLYPQMGGPELDGVLVVDPFALAALLEFTGPIEVEGFPAPLTAENAASILVRDQYLEFSDGTSDREGERVDFLDEASERTFEELVRGSLPSPREVAEVLSPVVEERHLLFHAFDDDERALFERVGAGGAFPAVDGGDFFQLVTQNKGNNKIDVFLHRSVSYEVAYNPTTGAVEATATITLRNDAPASGLPDIVLANNDQGLPLGTNSAYVSVYTPFGLRGAQLGDQPLPLEYQEELGRSVYSTYVEIPPGQERTLRLELFGTIDTGSVYRLALGAQPLVNADEVRVRLRVDGGWEIARSSDLRPDESGVEASTLVDLDHGTRLSAELVEP